MEILQIAKGRLKISLSKEELTEYGTNLECLEAGNASAKQALEVIFALVEAKTGLQLTGAQTLPQTDGTAVVSGDNMGAQILTVWREGAAVWQ